MPTIREAALRSRPEPGGLGLVARLVEIRCRIDPSHYERIWVDNRRLDLRLEGPIAAYFKARGWGRQTSPEIAWLCPKCYTTKLAGMFNRKPPRRYQRGDAPQPW